MGQMNKQMNLPALQKIMMEFEKQNERMEMVSEVMGDAMDDALGDDDEEEETEELVSQVLDEIGINVNQEVKNACLGRFLITHSFSLFGMSSIIRTHTDNLFVLCWLYVFSW
ncbi:unnamed protein product [Linum tenue]|uniref:SNF7 family protein n=1 Tax=Linum tenue TaxID=586396 RepID=A0AAV0HUU7_9ROSI|nr:unnamed protein product [Linum tenue]